MKKGRVLVVVLAMLAAAGCSSARPEQPQSKAVPSEVVARNSTPEAPVRPSVTPSRPPSAAPTVAAPLTPGEFSDLAADVRSFGAVGDGVADDRAAFQAAIDTLPEGGTIFVPRGTWRLSGQLLVSDKSGLTLQIARDATLLFDDGDYVGLLFTERARRCSIRGGVIRSNNKTNPRITLVRFERAAANLTVDTTEFVYGGTDVVIADSYIVKLLNTIHSNSNTAILTDNSAGPNADILISGPTFGTTRVGDAPVVDIHSIGTRLQNAYFETMSHTKPSVVVRTGTQEVTLDMHLYESGEVQVETSVFASIGIVARESYDSVTRRLLRVEGGAVTVIRSGSQMTWGQQSSIAAVSNAGGLTMSGVRISKAGTAIANSGQITASGLDISGSRIGLHMFPGSSGVISSSVVRGNSTDINYVGGSVSLLDIQADTVINAGGRPDRIRLLTR